MEIIAEIRKHEPQLPLSVRIPGVDFIENGISIDDSKALVRELEKLNINLVNVSSGIGGWKRPADREGEGYLVPEAHEVQKITSLPVIGVGGIQTRAYIEMALQEGRFSLAAVGRAILNDPTWGKSAGI